MPPQAKPSKKPQAPLDQRPLEIRLKIKKYTSDDCDDALHGKKVPVTLGHEMTRFCVIRGIRYHYGFAEELRGLAPEFTRALNARGIMSGVIPAISEPEEVPYCIWHPDVPDVSTLRALVQRYPQMLYHAARACAVAGYIDLYKELDPLPEVHVAEEASFAFAARRNNYEGAREIHELIISQQVKFKIMNDYNRTVNIANPRVSCLNGDTATYSSLQGGREYLDLAWLRHFDFKYPKHFNITEDALIDDHDHDPPDAPESYFTLLHEPLPADLPPINKDKLILAAAWGGDIDRYARLRRPKMIDDEIFCIIRALYHNSFWAKWWSKVVVEDAGTRLNSWEVQQIQRGINARRIMSDDVTWVTSDTPKDVFPLNIWYPKLAYADTYERLARIRPDMRWNCLYACIVADYPNVWDKLLLAPEKRNDSQGEPITRSENGTRELKLQRLSEHVNVAMWKEAKDSKNELYRQDIEAACPDKLKSLEHDGAWYAEYLLHNTSRYWYYPGKKSSGDLWVNIDDPVHISWGQVDKNDGVGIDMPSIDFAIFLRDAIGVDNDIWKIHKDLRLDYDEVYGWLDASEASDPKMTKAKSTDVDS